MVQLAYSCTMSTHIYLCTVTTARSYRENVFSVPFVLPATAKIERNVEINKNARARLACAYDSNLAHNPMVLHPFLSSLSVKNNEEIKFTEQNNTMAEFHAAGFSEFDKFFEGDSSTEKNEKDSSDALVAKDQSSKQSTGGKRSGIGSRTRPSGTSHSPSAEFSKRLLKVGSKRSRHQRDDDDDDDHDCKYDNRDADDDDDDDDEEDAGRTGISSKELIIKPKQEEERHPSKKKKIGKKERQRLKKEAEMRNETTISSVDGMGESDHDDQNTAENAVAGASSTSSSTATKNKRKPKRRKVRSRQKNIRKDNRALGDKPEHLRVGASNYQGRPLTDETRTKLNIAPSKTKTTGQSFFVVDRSPAAPKVAEEGILLGVDDLLAPEPTAADENNVNAKKNLKKKKKNKKKYKNL